MNQFVEPKLWAHQELAVKMASTQNNFAFLMDPGTGKTASCIKTLRCKYEKAGVVIPTLILAPVIVLNNWREEWGKFSRVPLSRVIVLDGPIAKRLKLLQDAIDRFQGNFIAIINYEIISTSKPMVDAILSWAPKCLVIDESQKIKSLESKRTKTVIKIADQATYKYLLTGTPVLNTPMDIFSQWRALDGGEGFGKNFFTFRQKYFYDKNANMPRSSYFPCWIIRENSYEDIKRIVSLSSLRARKEECLDLPPLVKIKHPVVLSPDQERHYNNMRDNFITYLESSAVVAEIALTKMMRMLQICTGFMKDEFDNIHKFESTPRQQALLELLETITPTAKCIVWCVYKENYEQVANVCNKLGVKYVEAHGNISTKDKYHNVELFNNDDSVKIFIGHPQSLGIGINLCSASYSVIYSRTWDLGSDLQSEARNYRAGSERFNKITKIDLYAKDTIDEGILDCLHQKMSDANKIVGFIKSFLKGSK